MRNRGETSFAHFHAFDDPTRRVEWFYRRALSFSNILIRKVKVKKRKKKKKKEKTKKKEKKINKKEFQKESDERHDHFQLSFLSSKKIKMKLM